MAGQSATQRQQAQDAIELVHVVRLVSPGHHASQFIRHAEEGAAEAVKAVGYGRDAQDAAIMRAAMAGAATRLRHVDQAALQWLDTWMGANPTGHDRLHQLALRRCQQLTSPVAAKAVEDTACYRYGRLLSRNEVGADPGEFAISTAAFHHAMQARSHTWPHAMLTTATHDHKRGEDVRARLAVLSERPAQWLAAVHQWRTRHAAWVHHLPSGPAPSPAAQWMLYQTLVGMCPADLDWHDAGAMHALAERAAQPAADRLHVLAAEEQIATPPNHAPGAARAAMSALVFAG
jgi:(1->4)-alpha-D-glucan 1-alpha-D-glucosylmutase